MPKIGYEYILLKELKSGDDVVQHESGEYFMLYSEEIRNGSVHLILKGSTHSMSMDLVCTLDSFYYFFKNRIEDRE